MPKTMVRACIRPELREELQQSVQGGACPEELRKAFAKGRYEGDICYFTVGGLLGDPWPGLKPFVEKYFEIEWEQPAGKVDREEVDRIHKLHTLQVKLGMGH